MYDEIISLEETALKLHNSETITKLYILDTLKNSEYCNKRNFTWDDFTILERKKLIDWVYNIYTKQETHLSLACICNTTMENKKQILADKYDKYDFFKILATKWL